MTPTNPAVIPNHRNSYDVIPKRLRSYKELAIYLGCAEITLRKAVSEGRLSCTKVGSRTVRFTDEQIADYLNEKSARRAS